MAGEGDRSTPSSRDDIRSKVVAYYGTRVKEHGATPLGVDWNSSESQRLRFEQLLRVVPSTGPPCTILDYGCGYGALVETAAEHGRAHEYLGFDLSHEMIERAEQVHGGEGRRFGTDLEALGPADFAVASGVFNVKLDTPVDEWTGYVLEGLDDLHRMSRAGFSFNLLTSYADEEHMRDDLYYADPTTIFDHCKRRYAPAVALLHDYGLYEFTVLVRKDAP